MNLNGARLIGININRFRLFCFGLSGGLGALAGIVITPITFTGYSVGLITGMKGLAEGCYVPVVVQDSKWRLYQGK